MKKTIGLFLSVLLIMLTGLSLVGCATKAEDPKDAIRNQYGNKEFTISFNTGGLETPIEDVIYTANKMPTLPSPSRVGYVFAGWYMDSSFSVPYVDGILYLYMKDVTLYAKWTKEELYASGVYDLEISSTILEDTIFKGIKTDEAGGYKDFADCIIYDEVCIENSDGHKYMKIPYDTGIVENMTEMESLPALKVMDSSLNSSAYIDETKTIANYADTRKTIFVNIDEWDIETPLYLDIKTTNYDNEKLSSDERAQTITTYTAKIEITRFIGFSKPYADYTQPLEDGWYLAKSYYRSENNTPNMGSGFNPVYSYLQVKNGRYSLIKQFTPYLGMLGASNTLLSPVTANYYKRLVSFAPVQLYYDMDASAFGYATIESDYYPATYNGTSYGEYVAEFHADTGKYYSIYDFGTDLTQEKMIMGGITGYMEVASSMGAANQILSIDYKHLVKLSEDEVRADYVPLTENTQSAYAYSEKMQYYPGDKSDLTERNLTYNAVKQYGMGTHLIDFFFSAQQMPSAYTDRKVHSSRITITPDKETAATIVSEARYSVAHFNVDALVYDYDEARDGSLYADSLTLQALGSNAMRENLKIKTGKSFSDGDKVSLESVFNEKVSSSVDFSSVSYVAYALKDGVIDYQNKVSLPASFTYGEKYRNIAVAFTATADGGQIKTIVYLTDYEAPTIKRVSNYDSDKVYTVGDVVLFPDIRYVWGGTENNFIDNYFANDDGLTGINIVRVAKFAVKSGIYTPTFFECVVTPQTSTALTEKDTRLLYELQNAYGERYYYEIVYSSESARRFMITDGDGNILDEGDVTYDKDGLRVPLNSSYSFYNPDYAATVKAINKTFSLSVGGVEKDLPLVSYTLYTDKIMQTEVPADNISAVLPLFEEAMQNSTYFYLGLNYKNGEDEITRKFLFNVSFGGKKDATVMNYDAYFINRQYVAPCSDIYSSTGVSLGSASSFSMFAYRGDELMNNIMSARYVSCAKDGYNVKTTFYASGRYRLVYSYQLTNLGGEIVYFQFVQNFEVLSDKAEVRITYVTDDEHLFADGTTSKTISYVLGDEMVTLKQLDNFLPTDARLFGWLTDRRQRPAAATLGGENFTGYETFNTTNVYLYALWDDGIRITTNVNGEQTTYDNVYYRATETNKDTGEEKGSYCIDLSVFTPTPPKDGDVSSYYFLGWTGGFIGTAIRNDKVYISGADITEEDLIISPVYKRYVRIMFTPPEKYVSGSYVFASASVLEGEKISNPGYYLRVRGTGGYTFKGWGVIVDGKATIIDLTKPIDATFADKNSYTLTLVAVFVGSEGNEVW